MLNLTVKMNLWMLLATSAVMVGVGRISSRDLKLAVIIALVTIVAGLIEAWRHK